MWLQSSCNLHPTGNRAQLSVVKHCLNLSLFYYTMCVWKHFQTSPKPAFEPSKSVISHWLTKHRLAFHVNKSTMQGLNFCKQKNTSADLNTAIWISKKRSDHESRTDNESAAYQGVPRPTVVQPAEYTPHEYLPRRVPKNSIPNK